MKSVHQGRVEEEIKKEISKIIGRELIDSRIGFVTISRVSVTKDLHFAKIFITVFNSEQNKSTLLILNKAKKHIRWLLAKRIKVRNIPELQFYIETNYLDEKKEIKRL